MTEEELIELSDLNREDNIKYISSEAQGIAITLDGDIYAPTLCKLERAYICGRRKSEEQIKELKEQIEKKNRELRDNLCGVANKLLDSWCRNEEDYCPHLSKLEKENKELKTVKIPQLERKIASIRGAHSVDCKKLNARLEQVERLKKENAELKELLDCKNCCELEESECGSCVEYGHFRCKGETRLAKAKELLRKFLEAKSIEETCVAESEAE